MALVTLAIFLTLRMRRLISRSAAMGCFFRLVLPVGYDLGFRVTTRTSLGGLMGVYWSAPVWRTTCTNHSPRLSLPHQQNTGGIAHALASITLAQHATLAEDGPLIGLARHNELVVLISGQFGRHWDELDDQG